MLKFDIIIEYDSENVNKSDNLFKNLVMGFFNNIYRVPCCNSECKINFGKQYKKFEMKCNIPIKEIDFREFKKEFRKDLKDYIDRNNREKSLGIKYFSVELECGKDFYTFSRIV